MGINSSSYNQVKAIGNVRPDKLVFHRTCVETTYSIVIQSPNVKVSLGGF